MNSNIFQISRTSSSSNSCDHGKLGIGAQVTAPHGVKKPLSVSQLRSKRLGKKVRQSRELLLGVVVASAPQQSWVVFWFEIEKTSRSTGQLTVLSNPTKTTVDQVKAMQLEDKAVDFESDIKLREYIDQKQALSDYEASGGKMPAQNLVTPTKPTPSSFSSMISQPPSSPKRPPQDTFNSLQKKSRPNEDESVSGEKGE